MKHLFRLALKYVTRQKLRTALMFLSVTLAVFVLNTFLVYTSSGIRTLRNTAIEEYGEWEADMSGVLEACEDGESASVHSAVEAANIISDHVAVDKSDIYLFDSYSFGDQLKPGSPAGFFNIELDNGTSRRMVSVFRNSHTADNELLDRYSGRFSTLSNELSRDEVIAPKWFASAGYNIGDTFTMTITPETGILDESTETMKSVRKALARMNAESDDHYYVIDGEEIDRTEQNGRMLKKMSLISLIDTYSDMNDIELKDREFSAPVKVTAKIAGFDNTPNCSSRTIAWFTTARESDFDLSQLDDSPLSFSRDHNGTCRVLTNPNTSFEYNMELILSDLGFTDEGAFDDFRYAMHGYAININTGYMLTSFRSFDGLGALMPYVAAYLVLLLIVWLFSRFIIDNAFEISVQERSVQFAALRVMGASKGQLAALVFTEGLFYTFTALPIGILTSTLACKYVFDSLHDIGMDYFEFYASPVTMLICVALCLSGIFISTYTSAMWASRKLTPAEALNYGKPVTKKKPKRSKKEAKSKLHLSSKRFMIRYTFKNIFRTKRRFIISSVAMGLGVLIFTICLQLGMALYSELREELDFDEPRHDFYIYCDALDADKIQNELMDTGNFAYTKYECHSGGWFDIKELEKLGDDFNVISARNRSQYPDGIVINYDTLDRNAFEYKQKELNDIESPDRENEKTSYAEVLGMSFEEYEKCKPILILPQADRSESVIFGYGYKKYDSPLTLTSQEGHKIEVGGVAYAGYTVRVLVPMSCLKEQINEGASASANLFMTVKDSEHYAAAKEAVSRIKDDGNEVYDEYRVGTGLLEFIRTIVEIALIFMLSIWLCGIVSMMNTINTSSLNRSKELLMMRAVGMTRRQLTGTVVLESLLFSSVSAIAGTILSIIGYQVIMRCIFARPDMTSSIVTLAASAVLNIAIAVAAALPGIRTINHTAAK